MKPFLTRAAFGHLFSTVASFESHGWRQLQYRSCEMDLDLHFTTLFSVIGIHLMCYSAHICNKFSYNNFSSKRWVFESVSNKKQVKDAMANIPQSTEIAVGHAWHLTLS